MLVACQCVVIVRIECGAPKILICTGKLLVHRFSKGLTTYNCKESVDTDFHKGAVDNPGHDNSVQASHAKCDTIAKCFVHALLANTEIEEEALFVRSFPKQGFPVPYFSLFQTNDENQTFYMYMRKCRKFPLLLLNSF